MLMEALLANTVLMNVSLMRMNYAQNITYPETFHQSLPEILLTKPGHSSNAWNSMKEILPRLNPASLPPLQRLPP